MKSVRIYIIFLVAAGIVLLIGSPALAGRGCQSTNKTDLELFVYPQAPGTKINASIAIYYGPPVEAPPYSMEDPRSMYVMMKVWRAGNEYAFSGVISPVVEYAAYYGEQIDAIGLYFQNTIMPVVLDCTVGQCPVYWRPDPYTGADPLPPYFAVKSITDVIEDWPYEPYFWPTDFNFMLMDIVIAVVD